MNAINLREDMQCRYPTSPRKPRYPSWSRPERTIGGAPADAPRTSLSATAVTRAANSRRSNGRRMYRRASSFAPANIQTVGPSVMARTRPCEDLSLSSLPGFPPLPPAGEGGRRPGEGVAQMLANEFVTLKASSTPLQPDFCGSGRSAIATTPSSALRAPSPASGRRGGWVGSQESIHHA